jgi:phosphoribosylformylglycinamidine synthase
MYHRLELATKSEYRDPRGESALRHITTAFGYTARRIRTRDVYSVFADIERADAESFLAGIVNPVIQTGRIGESSDAEFDWLIVIGYLPGVTDNVARSARAAAADVLGRPLGEHEHIYSSIEYLISAPELDRGEAEAIANNLFGNGLINSITVLSRLDWQLNGLPVNQPLCDDKTAVHVERFDFNVDDHALQKISDSRILALSLAELKAMQTYFSGCKDEAERNALGLDGKATDVELEILAQTWSEHCRHKIFDAIIDYTDDQILLRGAPQRLANVSTGWFRYSPTTPELSSSTTTCIWFIRSKRTTARPPSIHMAAP